MMLFLLCLFVPAALIAWKLCAAAGAADDRMEAALREGQDGSQAVCNASPAKEGVNAG